jgi:hypothetical protein
LEDQEVAGNLGKVRESANNKYENEHGNYEGNEARADDRNGKKNETAKVMKDLSPFFTNIMHYSRQLKAILHT